MRCAQREILGSPQLWLSPHSRDGVGITAAPALQLRGDLLALLWWQNQSSFQLQEPHRTWHCWAA